MHIIRHYFCLLLLAMTFFYLLPSMGHATNCFARDEEQIAHMYDIYVKSGKEPYIKKPHVSAVEPMVVMYGEIIGLQNYEECWFHKTPCQKPANYAPVRIDATISYETLKKQYKLDTKAIVFECFMKIGSAYKYTLKYDHRR